VPPRNWVHRIDDIIESIEKILRYTEALSQEQFQSDDRTRDAVIRNLTVIGEAARHIPDSVRQAHGTLPWREMTSIRNIVVHEYFGVSDEILWVTIQVDLPSLLHSLRAVRAEES